MPPDEFEALVRQAWRLPGEAPGGGESNVRAQARGLAVVQTLDSTIVGPRIVGGSVGLHPVWVIFALAVGSFFFGFVGLLLAMPAAVFIKLIVREALRRYHQSRVYEGQVPAEKEVSG